MTGTFLDYLCPTAPDLPTIAIAHHDSPSPVSPLGAKGLGEGNTMSRAGRDRATRSPTRSASTRSSCR